MAVPSAEVLARRAALFLRLWGVVATCHLLICLCGLRVTGEKDALETLETLAMLSTILNVARVVIVPVTPIVFLMWLHRVVRQMNAWGRDVGATPAWAVGCWFVPFVNVVKPFHVMRDIVEELGDEPLADSLHLGVWWCAFVLSRMMERFAAYMSALWVMPPWYAQLVYSASSIASSCTLVAAFLGARVVLEVQARLDSRRNGLSSPFR